MCATLNSPIYMYMIKNTLPQVNYLKIYTSLIQCKVTSHEVFWNSESTDNTVLYTINYSISSKNVQYCTAVMRVSSMYTIFTLLSFWVHNLQIINHPFYQAFPSELAFPPFKSLTKSGLGIALYAPTNGDKEYDSKIAYHKHISNFNTKGIFQ